MTLPTSLVILSTKALSFATSSFSAPTSIFDRSRLVTNQTHDAADGLHAAHDDNGDEGPPVILQRELQKVDAGDEQAQPEEDQHRAARERGASGHELLQAHHFHVSVSKIVRKAPNVNSPLPVHAGPAGFSF